jgi:hypothetical protein
MIIAMSYPNSISLELKINYVLHDIKYLDAFRFWQKKKASLGLLFATSYFPKN